MSGNYGSATVNMQNLTLPPSSVHYVFNASVGTTQNIMHPVRFFIYTGFDYDLIRLKALLNDGAE